MRARENPFRTARLERLAFQQASHSAEARRVRLAKLGFRGAIVGPHGSGKSTLLRELDFELTTNGLTVARWFVSEDIAPPPLSRMLLEARRLGPGDALLFDGAGHLGSVAWRCIRYAARHAGALVVSAHHPGLLPTWVETGTDPALLARLTQELIGESDRVEAALLDRLYAEQQGNLRDVFLALYDLAAKDDVRIRAVPPVQQKPRAPQGPNVSIA